jgi:hypothetical protein
MGTRASVKLQTQRGDALLLYTRWDGTKEYIKELGSHLVERWTRNVAFVEAWIEGKEDAFPVLSQWCKDTKAFLAQPETLGGAANLVSSASLNHLHPDLSLAESLQDKDRSVAVYRQLDNIDYCLTPNFWGEAHMRERGSKNIKPVESAKSLISIQYPMEGSNPESGLVWNELLYETEHATAEDVLKDVLTLPRFFREMSLITRDKSLRQITGVDILTDLSDLLERSRGKSSFDKTPDRETKISKEGMLKEANAMLPFGEHYLAMLGQHLALFKPGSYQPASVSKYLATPKRMVAFKIDEEGDGMVEASVHVAEDHQKELGRVVTRLIKNETNLRESGDLAVLFEGSSPVGVEVNGGTVKVKYIEDVISVLHTVANTPSAQINGVIERGLLRGRVGEKVLKGLKNPKAL